MSVAVAAERPWDGTYQSGFRGIVRPDWWSRASCRGAGPDGFTQGTPGIHGGGYRVDVCQSCPVRVDCAAEAVALVDSHLEPVGLWGGIALTNDKRARRGAIAQLRAVAGT
jgi:hypothetical protein